MAAREDRGYHVIVVDISSGRDGRTAGVAGSKIMPTASVYRIDGCGWAA
jgi:hypothetical protein